MACECFYIQIVQDFPADFWISKELSTNTPTGTFGNGQPYWVWFDAETNQYYELSQDNGVGVWKVRFSVSPIVTPNVADTLSTSGFSGDCPSNIGFAGQISPGGVADWFFSLDGFLDTNVSISSSASTWPCWNCSTDGFYVWFTIGEISGDAGAAQIDTPTGTFGNGSPYYQFELISVNFNTPSGYFFQLSRGTNGTGNWQLFRINAIGVDPTTPTDLLGSYTGTLTDENCPIGLDGKDWIDENGSLDFGTESGVVNFSKPIPQGVEPSCCFSVSLVNNEGSYQFQLDDTQSAGIYNGEPWWKFQLGTFWYNLTSAVNESGGCTWTLRETDNDPEAAQGSEQAKLEQQTCSCPISTNWKISLEAQVTYFATGECGAGCIKLQERVEKEYQSIKLPEIFEEEDRGFFKCCCPFMVLASFDSSDSFENDISSAWVKLSDPSDTFTFKLTKGGVDAVYQPTAVAFVKEANAYYITIPWREVLLSDGVGCYKIEITQNISGIDLAYTWGTYYLKAYSIESALKTARIKVVFDSFQEIEAIDFTDSQVEETFRFYGFIGNRQPNMEIDNLIYQNREVKKVIRENLNQYEILTDPLCDEFIRRLTDLYLLSENKLFISDYNAHNHTYRIQDVPVIVEESPEIEYYELARDASLKCIVGDKFKNKRSFYNG